MRTLLRIFVALCGLSLLAACGSPRTTIRVSNKADGTQSIISVKQGDGGSTSVDVHPSVNAALDSINFSVNR